MNDIFDIPRKVSKHRIQSWKNGILQGRGDGDIYIVANSFEPRCTNVTSRIEASTFHHSIIFQYEDTIDTIGGHFNLKQLKANISSSIGNGYDTLPCTFDDPFSIIRILHRFVIEKKMTKHINKVTIDITCFTKIHLLLLLKYLNSTLGIQNVRICYTEPLSYATSFGRNLSYGVDKTVYMPYQSAKREKKNIALIAFLGHERLRLEKIISEVEPDICVVIFGDPGYAKNIEDYSRRVNDGILYRATYDAHYRVTSASTIDFYECLGVLKQQLEVLKSEGCHNIYLAPLGTKLQSLSIDLLRRTEKETRMLLAYAIPKSYERSLYSLGIGRTYVGEIC